MAYTIPTSRQRECNDCGKVYDARRGRGGSVSRIGDERFPFDGLTGLSAVSCSWFHGAFCSDACYDHSYSE